VIHIPLRIIGIGSPFAGDRFGIEAVEVLRLLPELAGLGNEVGWCALDRPGVRLIERLKGAETVILIDAMQSGSKPGTVRRLALSDLLQQAAVPSSHQLGVAESLALAEALGDLPSRLLIYGIESCTHLMPQQWLPALQRLLSQDIKALLELE
jgi:hydrogenase maturation protease